MTNEQKAKKASWRKNWIKTVLLLLISILLSGCANQKNQTELLVGAAASLEPAMNELQEIYVEQNPSITLSFTFAGSGAIEQQIREGAPIDVFISAAEKQMNSLEEDELIEKDTRVNLLTNELVLVVPKVNTLDITGFEDITKASVIAIGDPSSVPAGQYVMEVFETLSIWEEVNRKVSLGKDVTEVLTWVSSGNAEAGVVYITDAMLNDKVKVIATAPEGSHKRIIYPAAVLKDSKTKKQAKDFVTFLNNEAAGKIFEKYGFVMMKEGN